MPERDQSSSCAKLLVSDVPRHGAHHQWLCGAGHDAAPLAHQLYQHMRDFIVAEPTGEIIGCGALQCRVGGHGRDPLAGRRCRVAGQGRGPADGRRACWRGAATWASPACLPSPIRRAFSRAWAFTWCPRETLPHKIWGDCLNCPKYPELRRNRDDASICTEKETSMKGEVKKCVLAYSGGLDTSVIVPWLQGELRLRGDLRHRRPGPGGGAGRPGGQGPGQRRQQDLHRGPARRVPDRLCLPHAEGRRHL